MNCPLEGTIPPEAIAGSASPPSSFASDEAFRRFAELVDSGLIWDPDTCPQARLAVEEGIQLENRGITSPNRYRRTPARAAATQAELWRRQTVHKFSIAAKLRASGMVEEAAKLELCHSYYTVSLCDSCGAVKKFPNRCDLFYCPECQAGLGRDRKKQIEWWTRTIRQPKHVVLTLKNIPNLTREHLDEIGKWFTALRRRKFAAAWRGGFYTIECTNEGKGWHIHIHALIDARWIDSAQLALQWDSVTHGFGRIVKVKDCRESEYLSEVTKYCCKGSQLAAWPAAAIVDFVRAFTGKRTFGVFGELYGARTEFAEFIATMKAVRPKCDCGCMTATYYSEADWLVKELQSGGPVCTRPPPVNEMQLPLAVAQGQWPD
jgi:hypothetical protein